MTVVSLAKILDALSHTSILDLPSGRDPNYVVDLSFAGEANLVSCLYIVQLGPGMGRFAAGLPSFY